jgi:hypothetical protein
VIGANVLGALLSNTWLVALTWAAMYIFDYGSTLWLADAYQTTISRHSVYEGGVELNPVFEKEIARRQAISPKFIAALVFYCIVILLSGLAGLLAAEVVAGATLLTWVFIDLRHLRNFFYVGFLRRRPESLQGQIRYSYWLLQRLISAEAFGFALMYGLFALLTGRVFFLMGAVTCLAMAARQYRLANRRLPMETRPGENSKAR